MSDDAGAHAQALAELVAELVDEVKTDEPVTRYQQVSRGKGRTITTIDPRARHITRDVGLLRQLSAIKNRASTIAVKVYRWVPDDGDQCRELCHHGHWEFVRTDARPAEHLGAATTGAAVPGGSPGWDEAGALNPLRSMGFESASPATGALELHDDIRRGVDQLRRDLRAAAGKSWGGRKAPEAALTECVGLLLDVDDDTAREAVRRVRAWVSTARIVLGYDAPIVRLRDVVCGECGGELHVRADASTAVWCAGHPATWCYGPGLPGTEWGAVEYPALEGCGERYPRGAWIKLLEQSEKDKESR
ncbi:hypothetical protein [Spirillospora sp. CA-294931]|uniref:hypothetical protein n=1 Tax=Spirillospora sp. CA-294931 TaxID=3240042 RepID=UPI003D8A986F